MDLIPVNPNYVFEQPKVRSQYVNPVTLRDWLVRMSNDAGITSDKLSQLNGRLTQCKLELRAAETDLADFESALLVKFPPSTNDRKTNKLLEAYVWGLVVQQDEQVQTQWSILRDRIVTLQDDIALIDSDRDACFVRLKALELQSENIRSHLSYVKAERDRR